MKKLSKNELLLMSLMLFSLFFGAGNLMFPPFLGQESGRNVFWALAGFSVTAIGFPVLGVLAVAKTKGLQNLASRVHPGFALVYTILIYLSIGPLLGIPRAGSFPFEMVVAPFLPATRLPQSFYLFLFTSIFFTLVYLLAMKPNKLVDRMGKILTPSLLFLLALVFIASLFTAWQGLGQPQAAYADAAFITGFLEGYLTMDTIAALNFGLVISVLIADLGVSDEGQMVSSVLRAGLLAGLFLLVIYASLAILGALTGNIYGATEHGAQTLIHMITHVFGNFGLFVLASIFTLASVTTAVGLVTSGSQYFSSISKLSYSTWVLILSLWSFALSNLGLDRILKISVPILSLIYPIALVLIVLSLLDQGITRKSLVYRSTVAVAALFSVFNLLSTYDLLPSFLKSVEQLAFYQEGLGWFLPSMLVFLVTYFYDRLKKPES